jgi:radical SAM superfamily enzyme YgiQ (UPF0313 family)
MEILLISPSKNSAVKKPRFLMIPQLALHLIAGLTPPQHQVKIVEEELEEVDLEQHCDLVGISCMTSNSARAYLLAREFRKRGVKVVLGGVHPTILPEEAGQHADSVVVGEAEGVWERLLRDAQQGRLEARYHEPHPSLERYVPIGRRQGAHRTLFNVVPIMTTRGCPYNCEFCCVHDIFGRRVRHVPVPNVVRDIRESGGRTFIFLDDNIVGDAGYARELFRAIRPLGIRWVGQATLAFAQDEELLALARDSGCVALFFGLESVSESKLRGLRKSIKELAGIREALDTVKAHGIYLHASVIFGFDEDTYDTFPDTLAFLEANRISSASINILTPYPGTEVFRRFRQEGRLLTEEWTHYDHSTVVFRPKNMSALELQAGRLWASREYTKTSSVLRRLPEHLDHPLLHLFLNLGMQAGCRKDLNGFPGLAERLFPLAPDAVTRPGLPLLRGARLADFLPGRDPSW